MSAYVHGSRTHHVVTLVMSCRTQRKLLGRALQNMVHSMRIVILVEGDPYFCKEPNKIHIGSGAAFSTRLLCAGKVLGTSISTVCTGQSNRPLRSDQMSHGQVSCVLFPFVRVNGGRKTHSRVCGTRQSRTSYSGEPHAFHGRSAVRM